VKISLGVSYLFLVDTCLGNKITTQFSVFISLKVKATGKDNFSRRNRVWVRF